MRSEWRRIRGPQSASLRVAFSKAVKVAVDGVFGLGAFGVDRSEFVGTSAGVSLLLLPRLFDCLVDQSAVLVGG
jgi:hypothetical protein